MGWILLAIVALLVLLLVLVIFWKARDVGRLLSPEHFRAIHAGIEQAVTLALGKPGATPDLEDGTAFLTPRELAFAVTLTDEQGTYVLHVSFSRPNGILSMAVASRIAGLVVVMLSRNQAELSPHVSRAGVFHLQFRLASPTIVVNPLDQVLPIVASQSPAVPFVPRESL
jgi:hypothetical protein